jgi:hypothetical protein
LDEQDIKEILWLIVNGYEKRPDYIVCKTCGKHIKPIFKGFYFDGYKQYCSYKCSINDLNKSDKSDKFQLINLTDEDILTHILNEKGNIVSTFVSKRHLMDNGLYDYIINRYNDNSTD